MVLYEILVSASPILTAVGTAASLIAVAKVWNINKKVYSSHAIKDLHENFSQIISEINQYIEYMNDSEIEYSTNHKLISLLSDVKNKYSPTLNKKTIKLIEETINTLKRPKDHIFTELEEASLRESLSFIKSELERKTIPNE